LFRGKTRGARCYLAVVLYIIAVAGNGMNGNTTFESHGTQAVKSSHPIRLSGSARFLESGSMTCSSDRHSKTPSSDQRDACTPSGTYTVQQSRQAPRVSVHTASCLRAKLVDKLPQRKFGHYRSQEMTGRVPTPFSEGVRMLGNFCSKLSVAVKNLRSRGTTKYACSTLL
jgi:hypothetical protein